MEQIIGLQERLQDAYAENGNLRDRITALEGKDNLVKAATPEEVAAVSLGGAA